jgi:hypothetical protein
MASADVKQVKFYKQRLPLLMAGAIFKLLLVVYF